MDINDLPDLSDWRYVEVWTIEEAAMLWAAIDPWDHETRRLNQLRGIVRIMQYKKAGTYQRAIAEAVCGGTLPFVKAWELHDDYQNGPWEKEINFPELPDSNKIIHHMTRISQAAFMKWVKSKNIPSYREFVIKSQQKSADELVTLVAVDKEEKVAVVSEAQLLLPPSMAYLDSTNPCSPQELRAASEAWTAVTGEGDPRESGAAVKAAIRKWLDNHDEYRHMSNEAKNRICTVSNWNKKGGATGTPD